MRFEASTYALFWGKVDTSGECWTWQAAVFEKGYGAFKMHPAMKRAHRVAFTMFYGPIPTGLQVNHHCDNPGCVRPEHLYVGTQLDNRRDAVRRGRTATGKRNGMHTHPESRQTGEKNFNSKLSVADVADIIRMHRAGASMNSLARAFGVSQPTVAYHVKKHRKEVAV